MEKIKIPNIPNYVAHPQSVWFECHWRPIFDKYEKHIEELKIEIERLKEYEWKYKDLCK